MSFKDIFPTRSPIIGMVHLLPLPGSPQYGGSVDDIYQQAEWEAQVLSEAGVDALIVENLGDEPYLIGEPTSEQFALMAGVTRLISHNMNIPIGVNVQFNAWQAELAIAHTCGAKFVRVEVFVDTVISAQGMIPPCSAQITRYRKALHAEDIQLWVDIQTKYTTNIVPKTLVQSAKEAQAAGADALIVTGAATGQATPLEAVKEVKEAVSLPVLVGSGTNLNNAVQTLQISDGAIVGSALKAEGLASNKVSKDAVNAFLEVVRRQGI